MRTTTENATRNRWIDVETPLAPGTLIVESISGQETLGRMFEYEIFVLSSQSDVSFDDLLGNHITVMMELNDGSRRPIDGRIASVGLVGMVENLFRYRIVARPWTWLMTRTTDCKIFQEKTVPEIIEEVLADQAEPDYEMNLVGNYAKREYCVQYRETDFNFVSRLLEEEGIYTYFRHQKGKHVLVICDAVGAHPSIGAIPFLPNNTQAKRGAEFVREWSVTREIRPGKAALRDYNFETPSTDLLVSIEEQRQHGEAAHEVYDYPGEYPVAGEGDHLVRSRLEEQQAAHEVIRGSGIARILHCGSLFNLENFARADQNREYLIVSTQIRARNNAIETGPGAGPDFQCRFELIPSEVPYRSPRATPKATVQGLQTAVVVGPAGEEIHVDKYARVKVQFHWDRYGQKDDKSSCWVRVSQIWAGKNYGWMTIPRIGQEVIVDFLEGNPDNPIVTGRVYNAEQMPPWALPDNKTQSGLLTRSSMGGSPANANELRFEDKKGEEQVYLHAEKNQDIEVENDETHWVGHDRRKTIDNDENVEVKNNRTEKVGVDEKITIGSNRTEDVGADEKITIGANRTEKVGANEKIDIGANRDETVGANETVMVSANRDHTIGASESITVGASRTDTVGASMTQTIGASVTQTIGASYTQTIAAAANITCGGAMTITAAGGCTILAPGGTKIVDMSLSQLGGALFESYGNTAKVTPMAMEAKGLVAETSGIKVEKAGVFNKQAGAAMVKMGAKLMSTDSAVLDKAGLRLVKAGLHMIG